MDLNEKLDMIDAVSRRLRLHYSNNRAAFSKYLRMYPATEKMTDEQLDDFVQLAYAVASFAIVDFYGDFVLPEAD